MKTIFRKLTCALFNHKYMMDIYFDRNVQKIKCGRCGKKFGINHSVKAVIEWDADLENNMRLIYPESFN